MELGVAGLRDALIVDLKFWVPSWPRVPEWLQQVFHLLAKEPAAPSCAEVRGVLERNQVEQTNAPRFRNDAPTVAFARQ